MSKSVQTVIVPPDHIVALMRLRATKLTSSKGISRTIDLARIERALIEAWTEGVLAGDMKNEP